MESPCQTSTPLKSDNQTLKWTQDTNNVSLKDLSAKSIDERFFQNLFNLSQSSNQKFRFKNRVIVTEEIDEILLNNDTSSKGVRLDLVFKFILISLFQKNHEQ